MATNKLIKLAMSSNIAKDLSDEKLRQIGEDVCKEYEFDKNSRSEWFSTYKKVMEIAKQDHKTKTSPWVGAANVKYPLIPDASIKYASRQYPQIIQGNKVVRCSVIGNDPTGDIEESADRISMHMSSQLLVQSNTWEANTDRLLHLLPVVGVAYKKVYYDPVEQHNQTELCTPDDIIINNNIRSIHEARRITQVLYKHSNYLQSMMNLGLYRNIDLKDLEETDDQPGLGEDKDKLKVLLEQHRYLDLDEDGYQEPYIVVVHKSSQKVLRICPRFDIEHVHLKDNKVIFIKPTKYFIDYHFIPSPDGTYHSIGYGQLLYPLNETANSLLNQLIDSGSLENTQGGFVLKGVRIKNGKIDVQQGVYNVVDAPNMDLKSSIMPFPTHAPSETLLKLLEVVLEAAKDLASITDVTQGQGSGENVKAGTTMTLLQQSLIVPNAIQKRLWRSFKEEFECLADLNRKYMDSFDDFIFAGKSYQVYKEDYNKVGISIEPVADPYSSTDSLKAAKAQFIMQTAELLSPEGKQHALEMAYKNINVSEKDIKMLLAPPSANTPPSPEQQQAEFDMKKLQMEGQHEAMDKQLAIAKLKADVDMKTKEQQLKRLELELKIAEMKHTANIDHIKTKHGITSDVHEVNLDYLDRLLEKEKLDNDKEQAESELAAKAATAGSASSNK